MQTISKNNCDFPTLRQSGCLYVDKTAWLYRMATDPGAYFFFLARPRRFGKSLMISTLKAMWKKRFELHWAETGKASFLMNFLKRGDVLAVDIDDPGAVVKAELDVSDLSAFPIKGMLYQTGYLTIADYESDLSTLRVPDEEVRQDLSALMSGLVADKDERWASPSTARRASSRAVSPFR